jgi:hypothetical protein
MGRRERGILDVLDALFWDRSDSLDKIVVLDGHCGHRDRLAAYLSSLRLRMGDGRQELCLEKVWLRCMSTTIWPEEIDQARKIFSVEDPSQRSRDETESAPVPETERWVQRYVSRIERVCFEADYLVVPEQIPGLCAQYSGGQSTKWVFEFFVPELESLLQAYLDYALATVDEEGHSRVPGVRGIELFSGRPSGYHHSAGFPTLFVVVDGPGSVHVGRSELAPDGRALRLSCRNARCLKLYNGVFHLTDTDRLENVELVGALATIDPQHAPSLQRMDLTLPCQGPFAAERTVLGTTVRRMMPNCAIPRVS